ncbi:MAG TPA: uroporphyrinogen decarboxylase family protein [Armatimonadota bacterium]
MMSNRSELLAAITRRTPSRLPYTFDAREETQRRLRQTLGVADDADLADYFGCNRFTSLWSLLGDRPRLPEREARHAHDPATVRTDIWGVKRELQVVNGAEYWEITEYPLAAAETVADIERYDWPTPEEVVFPAMPSGIDPLALKGDNVVLEMGYIFPFGIPWSMRGMEQMMIDLLIEPGIAEAIIAKAEQFSLGCLQRLFALYPGMIDLIGCGDDYGSQISLLMGPDVIERMFMPSLQRHYALGRQHGTHGYHHSCGAIFAMVPLFIAAGVEVLNPIQTSATGMDPVRLKREFGKDLCFHGAIDTQQTLATGTPAQVRAEVRQRVEELGPDGFILAPSHVMQPNVDPENIIALYDEVRTVGAWA